MKPTLESDLELATRVAKAAGVLLLELRAAFGPVEPTDSARRKLLKDLGDRRANELIIAALAASRPADAILSEESVDGHERDTADRVWIVDPLDGTAEYSQGRHDFAVHIALWDRFDARPEKLVLGVVDLPEQGITRTTGDLDVAIAPILADRPVRILVSRSRPPKLATSGIPELSRALAAAGITDKGVEIVELGSVGAKVNELLSDRVHAYVHDTGFYEWDVAAPLAVAHHYGLVATHLDGDPVTFNHRPPWVASLTVCSPALAPFLRSEAPH